MRVLATAELEHFYDKLINIPIVAFGMDDADGLYSVFGLAFEHDAWWAFFDVIRPTDNAGMKLRAGIRQVKRIADALGVVPKVVQDVRFQTSSRVISLSGFQVVECLD